MSSSNNTIGYLAFGVAIGVGIYWLTAEPDRWNAVVYPDRNDLAVDIRLGEFASLETCRAAALTKIDTLGVGEVADYECGLNCEPYLVDMLMCEETTR